MDAIVLNPEEFSSVEMMATGTAQHLAEGFTTWPELSTQTDAMTRYLTLMQMASGILLSYANLLKSDLTAFKAAGALLEEANAEAARAITS